MLVGVAARVDIDREARAKVRAWFWYFLEDRGYGSQVEMARDLKISAPGLNQILNGRSLGFDAVLRLSRKMHKDINAMADTWPPGHEKRSGRPPRDEKGHDSPEQAPPMTTRSAEQRRTGGQE